MTPKRSNSTIRWPVDMGFLSVVATNLLRRDRWRRTGHSWAAHGWSGALRHFGLGPGFGFALGSGAQDPGGRGSDHQEQSWEQKGVVERYKAGHPADRCRAREHPEVAEAGDPGDVGAGSGGVGVPGGAEQLGDTAGQA